MGQERESFDCHPVMSGWGSLSLGEMKEVNGGMVMGIHGGHLVLWQGGGQGGGGKGEGVGERYRQTVEE